MIKTPTSKEEIDELSQYEMAWLWRFSKSEDGFFSTENPLSEYFIERFNSLGGMTPAISKRLGWD